MIKGNKSKKEIMTSLVASDDAQALMVELEGDELSEYYLKKAVNEYNQIHTKPATKIYVNVKTFNYLKNGHKSVKSITFVNGRKLYLENQDGDLEVVVSPLVVGWHLGI